MKKRKIKIIKYKKRRKKSKKGETPIFIRKREKTYIEGFDKISNGGFIKNSNNVICGSAGSGKTIFCTQFLINGIEKNKETCLMISFEESKNKFFKNMRSVGIDLKKYEKRKKFIFLSYSPEQVKQFIAEGGGIIENIVEKNNVKRLVIDSLTAFTLLFRYEAAQREACLELFKALSNWNCTTLLTEEDKPSLSRDLSTVLDFEVDGVIFLYNLRIKDERQRAIEIVKMRGTKHARRIFPFEITDNGIFIDLKKHIYNKI